MKICPKCGTAIADDALFCTMCGSKLVVEAAAPAFEEPKTEEPAAEEPKADAPAAEPAAEEPKAEIPHLEIPPVTPNPGYQQAYQQNYQQAYHQTYQQPYQAAPDPYDHTADYDTKDISEHKVVAMIAYLMGTMGVIIAALIGATSSPYTMFHVRQVLKFTVVEILAVIVIALLCWTVIIPIVGGIALAVLGIIKIICFFQVCSGKAVEAPIIRSLKFLN